MRWSGATPLKVVIVNKWGFFIGGLLAVDQAPIVGPWGDPA